MSDKYILYFGGSFNPPHKGHIRIAEYLSRRDFCHSVIVAPAAQNPLKSQYEVSFKERYRMCQMAFYHLLSRNVLVSDIEDIYSRTLDIGQPYMYDILEFFDGLNNSTARLRPVIGSDCLIELADNKWHNSQELLADYPPVVICRPGVDDAGILQEKFPDLTFVKIPGLTGLSSTEVRNNVKSGFSIKDSVPDDVANYITKNKLYL